MGWNAVKRLFGPWFCERIGRMAGLQRIGGRTAGQRARALSIGRVIEGQDAGCLRSSPILGVLCAVDRLVRLSAVVLGSNVGRLRLQLRMCQGYGIYGRCRL